MSKNKHWSKQEDRVLLRQVATNAKMQKAFEKASRLLNRTPISCKQRWYKIKDKEENLCFMTIGHNYRMENSRVLYKNKKSIKQKLPIWKKILNIFKNMG